MKRNFDLAKAGNSKEKVKNIRKSAIDVAAIPDLVSMPMTLDPEAFAKARTAEVMLLKKEIADGEFRGTRRVFQTLPRSMRRRAASHNIRRLPVRLREKALAEAAKDPSAVPKTLKKPPCRRRRRRPCNIGEEFGRRQQDKLWLETHMWHAKRAHMEDHWGYRVAMRSNEKCLKSCIRASSSGCFLYDRSYFELVHFAIGQMSDVSSLFPKLGSHQVEGIGKTRPCFIETCMHSQDGTCIGPVEVIAVREADETKVTLAVHPLISDHVMSAFSQTGIVVASRSRQEYCIFDLEGSNSLATLGCILSLPISPTLSDAGDTLPNAGAWIFSAADPRFSFPQKPGDLLPRCEEQWTSTVSDFWNYAHQEQMLRTRTSEHQLNIARAQHVIPGTRLIPTADDPRMPVLLLTRSDTRADGRRHHRWTVIVPFGWGRCLWRSLIFAKARFGGLKEYALVQFEHGRPHFPIDFPRASLAFSSAVTEIAAQHQLTWDRTPPAKRINYSHHGISSPFYPDFSQFSFGDNLHICRIEYTAAGVPQYNARVYREADNALIGLVTTGGFSQLAGKGVAVASCLLSQEEASSFLLSIPVAIQNISGGPQRPGKITRIIG